MITQSHCTLVKLPRGWLRVSTAQLGGQIETMVFENSGADELYTARAWSADCEVAAAQHAEGVAWAEKEAAKRRVSDIVILALTNSWE